MLEIFEKLGILGVLGALIIYLVQQLSLHLLNRDIKKYELEINQETEKFKNELNLSLEKHKSELNLIYTKASKLHDKRLDHIAEIYSLLTEFHDYMQLLIGMKNTTGMTEEEKTHEELKDLKNSEIAGNQFLKYYSKHKLYFELEICSNIEEIIKLLRESHVDFSFKYIFGIGSPEFEMDKIKGISKNVREKVPELKKDLEKSFRELLGVV